MRGDVTDCVKYEDKSLAKCVKKRRKNGHSVFKHFHVAVTTDMI